MLHIQINVEVNVKQIDYTDYSFKFHFTLAYLQMINGSTKETFLHNIAHDNLGLLRTFKTIVAVSLL